MLCINCSAPLSDKILYLSVSGSLGRDRDLFLAQAFASMGIAGIGLGLLFQVPQILIYVPLFLWMMEEADKKADSLRIFGRSGRQGRTTGGIFCAFLWLCRYFFLGI